MIGGLGGRDAEILALIDRAPAAPVEQVEAFDAAEEYTADYQLRAWADVSRAELLQLERFAHRLRTTPTHSADHAGKPPGHPGSPAWPASSTTGSTNTRRSTLEESSTD